MSDGSARKVRRLTAACVVTVLSCTAAFLSVLTAEPGHKPLPGTRTAVELLAKGSQRTCQNWREFMSRRRARPFDAQPKAQCPLVQLQPSSRLF